MYPTSIAYKNAIAARSTRYEWFGTITFKDDSTLSFTHAMIDQNKSKITRQCVTGENLEIGNVFSAELRLALRDTVDFSISTKAYNYYDAEIRIYFKLYLPDGFTETIPCGIFIVTEVERTYHTVSLTAYDYAYLLNKKMEDDFTTTMSPYAILDDICILAIGPASFGMSQDQIEDLPNGERRDLDMTIYKEGTSYKEVMGNVCTLLGSNAMVNRDGKVIIVKYGEENVRALTPAERYSTSYVDYQGRYNQLYYVNKRGEVVKYGSALPLPSFWRALAMNIGKNTLLNSYDESSKNDILDEIENYIAQIKYAPCTITMPCDPSIDVADLISVIGGEITGAYTKTLDTSVDENKTYYTMTGGTLINPTFVPVTPVGDENPYQLGWYEIGTSAICTKIEMPFFGQMKIRSEAGSYELDIDPYATEKEQEEKEDKNDQQDKWDTQNDYNEENDDKWEDQDQHNEDTDDAIEEIDMKVDNLAVKMAINYIFPYAINTDPIADGGNANVLRFRFTIDRDGDIIAFYAMLSFTATTTESSGVFSDCNLSVNYVVDGTTTTTAVHTYRDGYAILTLNGCFKNLTAGQHTFDVNFALSGGGIS